MPAVASDQYLPTIGRRALDYRPMPEGLTPYFITPSSMQGRQDGASPIECSTVQFGDRLELSLPTGADRGLLIHRALELLGQDVPADTVIGLLGQPIMNKDWIKIQAVSSSFTGYLQERFKPLKLHWEVPILSVNRDHSVIGGTVDLLVETTGGCWIVGHKSDEPTDIDETFNHYLPQLECYAQALAEGMGLNVLGIAIHWTCLGAVGLASATN